MRERSSETPGGLIVTPALTGDSDNSHRQSYNRLLIRLNSTVLELPVCPTRTRSNEAQERQGRALNCLPPADVQETPLPGALRCALLLALQFATSSQTGQLWWCLATMSICSSTRLLVLILLVQSHADIPEDKRKKSVYRFCNIVTLCCCCATFVKLNRSRTSEPPTLGITVH